MLRSPTPLGELAAISEDETQDVYRQEPFAYYQTAAQKLVDNPKYGLRNAWMAEVADNTPLYTINIPGSRDSLHGHEMSIMHQLNAGIRFIDVTAHVEPKTFMDEDERRDLSSYTLQVSGDAGFYEFGATVLNPCLSFLTANATETVIMLITVGTTVDETFPNISEVFLNNYVIDRRDWVFDSANPSESNPMRWTMGDCRSRIVLITRGRWNNLLSPNSRSLEFPEHFDTNGIFEKEETLYGFMGETGPYDKAARVISKISEVMLSTPNAIAPNQPIDKTRENIYNKFYITFVPGYPTEGPPPEETYVVGTSGGLGATEDADTKDFDLDGPNLSLVFDDDDGAAVVDEKQSAFMSIVNLYLTEFLMVSLIRSRRVGWIILDNQEEAYDHLVGLVIRSNDPIFDRPQRLQPLWTAPPIWTENEDLETPEPTGDKMFDKICQIHGILSSDRGLINVGFGERVVERDDIEVQWITRETDGGETRTLEMDSEKILCGLALLYDIIPASGTWGVKNIRGIYTDGSTTEWLGDNFAETSTTKLFSKILMFGIGSVRAVYIPNVGIVNLAIG